MKLSSRAITSLVAGTLGIVAAIFILGAFDFQIFGEEPSGNPKSTQDAVSRIISAELTNQISYKLQSQDPCLEKIVAKPANTGIVYNYYDLEVPKEIYPIETVRMVVLDANDYQVKLYYSSADSCAYRADAETLERTLKYVSGGPYFINPTTYGTIDTGTSEATRNLEQTLMSRASGVKPSGSGTYTESLATLNTYFDTNKCCRLESSEQLDEQEQLNARY